MGAYKGSLAVLKLYLRGSSASFPGSSGAATGLYVNTASGVPLRRANPNTSFVQRASSLQLLGSLGSYVTAPDGSIVTSPSGSYVYSEA